MKYTLPHTIKNPIGETLIFKEIIPHPDGDKVLVENFVTPKSGPPMHTHFLQDECLTVVTGKIGYQILGEEPKYATVGETVMFKRGVPHRFWNAGEDILHCEGFVQPVNNIMYFLTAIYEAQQKTNSERPESFDTAFLTRRYKSEFRLEALPSFVRNIIMPTTYYIGKFLGKYKHFKNAPDAIKA